MDLNTKEDFIRALKEANQTIDNLAGDLSKLIERVEGIEAKIKEMGKKPEKKKDDEGDWW